MGAGIYWRPVATSMQRLEAWAPDHFRRAMCEVFGGDGPWTVGRDELPKLRAMAAVISAPANEPGDTRAPNPYRELIMAVEQVGDVEVFLRY